MNYNYDYKKFYDEHKGLSIGLVALELCAGLTIASCSHKIVNLILGENRGLLKRIGIGVLDFAVLDKTISFVDHHVTEWVKAEMRYEQRKAAEKERKEQEEAEDDGEPADGSEV